MMEETKRILQNLATDARDKAEELEESQDDKEDLDQDFFHTCGQISAYNHIASVMEKLIKEG